MGGRCVARGINNKIMTLIKKLIGFIKKFFSFGRTIITSNNPKLTELMSRKMSFRELKEEEFELNRRRLELTAKQSSLDLTKRWYKEDYSQVEYNNLSDEIYRTDDSLVGIKTKLREMGFEYEYMVQSSLPNNHDEFQIWTSRRTIILEKDYPLPLSKEDLIEFLIQVNMRNNEELVNIRKINK